MNKNIELLSPAGDFKSLIAAVQNGADAIYLGTKEFNARASANNFNREELKKALYYAHFRNVKIYIVMNILLSDAELNKALEYINYLYQIGVDAVIIQDIGLAKLIRENFSKLPIHASTQMTINNLQGAKLLEDLGFKRVVLARETPLKEIKLIKENTNLEIEFFAHGALCVSYSGQCLMSSMIGGRSGNRGRCAQPCRKSYEVLDKNLKHLNTERAYLLSPKDLMTIDHIYELIEVGVTTLKLEGRMKRPDYVATITRNYHNALDGKSYNKGELTQAFNRKFTKGLPLGDFGSSFSNIKRQNNQGVKVGEVKKSHKGHTLVNFTEAINKDDILEFINTKSQRQTFQAPDNFKKGEAEFRIPFDVKTGEIRRIIDVKLVEKAEKSFEEDNLKRPLDLKFTAKLNEKPILYLDDLRESIKIIGDFIIEKAKNRSVTEESIYENLDRLGNTDYILNSTEIDIDENIFLPISLINNMRRDGIEALKKKFISSYERENVNYSRDIVDNRKSFNKFNIHLSFKNPAQLNGVDFEDIKRVYLNFIDDDIVENLKTKGIEVYYRSDKILQEEDYIKINKELQNTNFDGIMIDNLGGVKAFSDYKLIADYGLNIFNSYSSNLLYNLEVKEGIISPELSLNQIAQLNKQTKLETILIAYSHIKAMTMEYCPFSNIKGCKNNQICKKCNFSSLHFLKDEMGINFPIIRKNQSTIYNSYPINMINKLEDIKNANIENLLLDFTIEENPNEIINQFKKQIEFGYNNLDIGNYGNYYRGVE